MNNYEQEWQLDKFHELAREYAEIERRDTMSRRTRAELASIVQARRERVWEIVAEVVKLDAIATVYFCQQVVSHAPSAATASIWLTILANRLMETGRQAEEAKLLG